MEECFDSRGAIFCNTESAHIVPASRERRFRFPRSQAKTNRFLIDHGQSTNDPGSQENYWFERSRLVCPGKKHLGRASCNHGGKMGERVVITFVRTQQSQPSPPHSFDGQRPGYRIPQSIGNRTASRGRDTDPATSVRGMRQGLEYSIRHF
jgi:hypothetical protein